MPLSSILRTRSNVKTAGHKAEKCPENPYQNFMVPKWAAAFDQTRKAALELCAAAYGRWNTWRGGWRGGRDSVPRLQ